MCERKLHADGTEIFYSCLTGNTYDYSMLDIEGNPMMSYSKQVWSEPEGEYATILRILSLQFPSKLINGMLSCENVFWEYDYPFFNLYMDNEETPILLRQMNPEETYPIIRCFYETINKLGILSNYADYLRIWTREHMAENIVKDVSKAM